MTPSQVARVLVDAKATGTRAVKSSRLKTSRDLGQTFGVRACETDESAHGCMLWVMTTFVGDEKQNHQTNHLRASHLSHLLDSEPLQNE
jgi:hypothetical protein